jgi:hypothetical protein
MLGVAGLEVGSRWSSTASGEAVEACGRWWQTAVVGDELGAVAVRRGAAALVVRMDSMHGLLDVRG